MTTTTRIPTTVSLGALCAAAASCAAHGAIVFTGAQNAVNPAYLLLTSDGTFYSPTSGTSAYYDMNWNPVAPYLGAYSRFGAPTNTFGTLNGVDKDINLQTIVQVAATRSSGSAVSQASWLVTKFAAGDAISSGLGTLAYSASTGSGFAQSNTGSGPPARVLALNGGGIGNFNGTEGYYAFRFSLDNGAHWRYGWALWAGANGTAGGTLKGWAYNDVLDQQILAGQTAVPAPGATALLASGAPLLRRRRRAG